MIVNCVYRIHSRGVVLDGKFDTDEGLILECPELCQVDMTDYHYILDAYPGVGDSMEYLHYMLQDASCAIAAIGFNRIGCILVGYEEAHAVYAVRGELPRCRRGASEKIQDEDRVHWYCAHGSKAVCCTNKARTGRY